MRKDFTAENAATVMATFCEIDLLDPNKRFTKKIPTDSVRTHRPAKGSKPWWCGPDRADARKEDCQVSGRVRMRKAAAFPDAG
jgi:hypothetical protein